MNGDCQRKQSSSQPVLGPGGERHKGAYARACRAIGTVCIEVLVTVLLVAGQCAYASDDLSKGQIVYVPVYSQVHFGEHRVPFLLAVTLVVRNTDLTHPIELLSAAYYDSSGQKVHEYVENPVKIGALASLDFFLKESDDRGGASPTFIVRWRSAEKVTAPMIETIMIGTARQQGISFISTGRVLKETSD